MCFFSHQKFQVNTVTWRGGGSECHHDVVLPTPKVPGKHGVCVGGGDNVIMHYFPHQKFQVHVDMGGGEDVIVMWYFPHQRFQVNTLSFARRGGKKKKELSNYEETC